MTDQMPRTIPINQSVNCRQCGIELFGSDSDECPKCGAPTIWKKIAYFNWDDFNLAANILEEAGILIIKSDAGLGIGGYVQVVTGHTSLSEIWIGKPDIERGLEILEASGLSVSPPLVDRNNPICPVCDEQLDLFGTAICKSCNTPYCWTDFDEPEVDTTGLNCKKCGYDLTGNTTRVCSECNYPIPIDLDALVASATKDDEQDQESSTFDIVQAIGPRLFSTIIVVLLIICPVIFLVITMFSTNFALWIGAGQLALGACISLLLIYIGIKVAINVYNSD